VPTRDDDVHDGIVRRKVRDGLGGCPDARRQLASESDRHENSHHPHRPAARPVGGHRHRAGGFQVAGDHPGIAVRSSHGVSISKHVSGWAVTFVNETDEEQFVTAQAVCEAL
jgi:hypothetical protein